MNIASDVTVSSANKTGEAPISVAMPRIGIAARAAARELAHAPGALRNNALRAMAKALRDDTGVIVEANAIDVGAADAANKPAAFVDRLSLDAARVDAMAASIDAIAELDDPVGATIAAWERPNGLHIERVRQPLGVIGIIYESRPNVTSDAAALCLKSGNASILRGGSDSLQSARAIERALHRGLSSAGLPEAAIQVVPTIDREAVSLMLAGLDGTIDLIVPRGGRSLVERVERDARVPVFAHLDGICHVYVDAAANLDMARDIVVNAKMRRTGICGAAETLLVDRAVADTHLAPLLDDLHDAGCEIRGDAETTSARQFVIPASETDWSTEYLDAIISVRLIDGVDGALDHIARYGSQHTEAIVTDDADTAARFLQRCESAITLHNASTQFADGGEFGMGAEIGIATGKMHARGPVGVEQLTTFRYVVQGSGQTRPS